MLNRGRVRTTARRCRVFIHLKRYIEQLRTQFTIPMTANNERTRKDYVVPSQDEPHSSIAPPTVQANNYELKPSLLQIVQ